MSESRLSSSIREAADDAVATAERLFARLNSDRQTLLELGSVTIPAIRLFDRLPPAKCVISRSPHVPGGPFVKSLPASLSFVDMREAESGNIRMMLRDKLFHR